MRKFFNSVVGKKVKSVTATIQGSSSMADHVLVFAPSWTWVGRQCVCTFLEAHENWVGVGPIGWVLRCGGPSCPSPTISAVPLQDAVHVSPKNPFADKLSQLHQASMYKLTQLQRPSNSRASSSTRIWIPSGSRARTHTIILYPSHS